MYSYGEGKNSIDYTLQGSSAQSRGGGMYKGEGAMAHLKVWNF